MSRKELKKIPLRKIALKNSDYVVSAKIVKTGNESIMVTTIYDGATSSPLFRVFSDHDKFVNWDYEKGKWMNFSLEYRADHRYSYEQPVSNQYANAKENISYDTKDSMTCGIRYYPELKTNQDTITVLKKFQTQVRERQLNDLHKKRGNEIDRIMTQVQPLPKGFRKWIDQVPLKKSRYIYYKRHGKMVDGYCTVCGKDVVLPDARHNQTGVCPNCHRQITFKAVGKSKNINDGVRAEYLQKLDEGRILSRIFYIRKSYTGNYRRPDYSINEECRRVIYPDGKDKCFVKNDTFAWLGQWKPLQTLYYYAYLYSDNVSSMLDGTAWQYCGILQYAKKSPWFTAADYLVQYIKYPSLEYVAKLGLSKLIDVLQGKSHEICSYYHSPVNWKGKNVMAVLGISKKLIPITREMNVTSKELKLLQQFNNSSFSSEKIKETIQWLEAHYSFPEDIHLPVFLQYMGLDAFENYILKQAKKDYGNEKDNKLCYYPDTFIYSTAKVTGWWEDYLNAAKLIGYDMKNKSILFPKELKKAHDRAIKLVDEKKNELYSQKINSMFGSLESQYGFSACGFLIRPPKDLDELINEGEKLHHCVATYAGSVAMQQTTILFIRKINEPDKPLFTLEVNNGHIVQARGMKDHDPSPEGEKFISLWAHKKRLMNRSIAVAA